MVCVDPLRNRGIFGKGYVHSCHLFDDMGNVEELHKFALEIGCRRAWFQDKINYPHYDLTRGMRSLAVKHGAKEVDTRYFVTVAKNYIIE